MKSLIWLFLPVLFLTSCGMPKTAKDTQTTPTEGRSGAVSTGTGVDGGGAVTPAQGQRVGGIQYDQYGRPVNRLIYFDYDQSDVKAEYRALVEAHARYLAGKPNLRARLEGHADERGSREYNLALGERRARAVQRMMTIVGASSGQLNLFSYGEEKPVRAGHDEASWRENRRVEIVYLGGR